MVRGIVRNREVPLRVVCCRIDLYLVVCVFVEGRRNLSSAVSLLPESATRHILQFERFI